MKGIWEKKKGKGFGRLRLGGKERRKRSVGASQTDENRRETSGEPKRHWRGRDIDE